MAVGVQRVQISHLEQHSAPRVGYVQVTFKTSLKLLHIKILSFFALIVNSRKQEFRIESGNLSITFLFWICKIGSTNSVACKTLVLFVSLIQVVR